MGVRTCLYCLEWTAIPKAVRKDSAKFNGFVQTVETDSFWIRFIQVPRNKDDKSKLDPKEYQAEVPFVNVPKSEHALITEGAYFNWTIDGPRSRFYFSRRKWSKTALAKAKREAEKLFKKLKPLE